jgi:hypothetical protein
VFQALRFIFRKYGNCNRFSREPEEDPLSRIQLTHQLAKGSPGLRARLRLEQRLLRSKDVNGLWWAHLSSEIIVEIKTYKIGDYTCEESGR